MAIKSRFLISTALILLLTGFFSWLSMRVLAEGVAVHWIELYAEKQLRYDKVRTLLPLIQEVNLSIEFAELESLKAWARQPNDESLKQQALLDAETFKPRFAEKSYFIALKKNGHYYYSDKDSIISNTHNAYRYILDANKATDAWFYKIMAIKKNLHLNVNSDIELGVVKLWSDVLIQDGEEVLGVVGTGLDLSTFLDDIIEKQDVYSSIIFTNYEGSIQLHQQEELIDFAAVTKQAKDKRIVFQLLDDDSSKAKLKKSFELAKAMPNSVETTTVYKHGVRQFASVIYLPEIDWFQVNFIDIKGFLPWTEFSGLFAVFLVSLLCALAIFYVLVTCIITKPLEELDRSIQALENNETRPPKLHRFAGLEIKRLVSHYQKMSDALLSYQHQLEAKVAERTESLNLLSQLDPLTNLYNRRGFENHMTDYMRNWQEHQQTFSLISVDINDFKLVNDKHGHAVGDLVLQEIAAYLTNIIEGRGEVARWGGDEFLILTKSIENQNIVSIQERLMRDSDSLIIALDEQNLRVQFSLGCTDVQENDTLEDMMHRADSAMYSVKPSTQ